MSRVIIIGIDAMDSRLLSRFEKDLPYLSQLQREHSNINLTCVYPPDTPTAWASAYTGLNPAQHGVVYFVDPLEKLSIFATQELDNQAVQGRTFWDFAGSLGKRCAFSSRNLAVLFGQ